jgi:hypothetical protein
VSTEYCIIGNATEYNGYPRDTDTVQYGKCMRYQMLQAKIWFYIVSWMFTVLHKFARVSNLINEIWNLLLSHDFTKYSPT